MPGTMLALGGGSPEQAGPRDGEARWARRASAEGFGECKDLQPDLESGFGRSLLILYSPPWMAQVILPVALLSSHSPPAPLLLLVRTTRSASTPMP